MTDDRREVDPPLEHDEYHSSLEIDDSSGWRVFIVPGILLLFLIGAVMFIVLGPADESGPDPRIAERLKNEAVAAPTRDTAAEAAAAAAAAGEPEMNASEAVKGTPIEENLLQ